MLRHGLRVELQVVEPWELHTCQCADPPLVQGERVLRCFECIKPVRASPQPPEDLVRAPESAASSVAASSPAPSPTPSSVASGTPLRDESPPAATDCTADDDDGSGMMLFPPTPTSTQPPSPRPAEPPQCWQVASALQNLESEEPVEDSSEEESEGPTEGFYLRHNCYFNGFNSACRCERCLRAFALILRKRAEAIIVYSMSGEEHRIKTLTGTSTFLDFYVEAWTVLGLPLKATSTSMALVFPVGATEL